MFCFNPSLWPSVQWYKKREAGLSLALSLSQLTPTPLNICGEELGGCAIHLPTCPPHSLCGNLLLRLVPMTGRPICISVGTPIRIYKRMLTIIRLGDSTLWLTVRLLRHDSLLRSLCLRGLFPPSDLWYSSHSPSHQPSTSTYSAYYSYPLVEYEPHWVLCRWLAGVNQRITLPLFLFGQQLLFISFFSLIFSHSLPILYQI